MMLEHRPHFRNEYLREWLAEALVFYSQRSFGLQI